MYKIHEYDEFNELWTWISQGPYDDEDHETLDMILDLEWPIGDFDSLWPILDHEWGFGQLH